MCNNEQQERSVPQQQEEQEEDSSFNETVEKERADYIIEEFKYYWHSFFGKALWQ